MSVGIIFLEQLYPWPEAELQAALDQHPNAQDIVWVQEEPANMSPATAQLGVKRQRVPRNRLGKATRSKNTLIDLALGSAI